jgi:hypothetical protein
MLKQLDVLIGFVVVMSIVSLLVTIMTQIISSLLGLRGKNLFDSLRAMMRGIDPNLPEGSAQQLANYILTRPVISDSILSMSNRFLDRVPGLHWLRDRAKKATAIRVDELYEVIADISHHGARGGVVSDVAAQLQDTANRLLKNLRVTNPATANAIAVVNAQLSSLVGKNLAEARTLIQQVGSATNVALLNLEKWFNSAQDRAQQWFTFHTHLITIVAAFIAAFVLQLDTLDLIKRISADSELRDKLVAASPNLQGLASDVLTQQKDRISASTHKATIVALRRTYPQLSAVLADHGDFASTTEAQAWLGDRLKTNPDCESIISQYLQNVTALKLQSSLDLMTKVAGTSPIQLLPYPYPVTLNKDWPHDWGWFGVLHVFKFRDAWSWPPHRLFGILISAALLSLGAPFWFNMLKSLTNLRPKLADEIDKDPKQIPQISTTK